MKISLPRVFAAIVVLLLPAVLACGRKTPPQVPDSPRPEVVKNITIMTRENIAFLSWPIPVRNVEGKPLAATDVVKFRIYRAETGRDKRKARLRLYTEIELKNPSPAVIRDGMILWSDHSLSYGQSYEYMIRAVSVRGGVSSLSEEVRVTPSLSPAAPQGITAQGGDGYAIITWNTVTARTDKSSPDGAIGYNIYRGTEAGRYDTTPLNKELLRTNSFTDSSVANGRTYFYIIRTADSPAPPWRESLDSQVATATPKDMTPPSRPAGLTVVPGIGRVFLTWNENNERDLAGYYVYRSDGSGKPYIRQNDAVLARTTFSDETTKQGAMYLYRITAVDQTGNESEPSEEKHAYVEKMVIPR